MQVRIEVVGRPESLRERDNAGAGSAGSREARLMDEVGLDGTRHGGEHLWAAGQRHAQGIRGRSQLIHVSVHRGAFALSTGHGFAV